MIRDITYKDGHLTDTDEKCRVWRPKPLVQLHHLDAPDAFLGSVTLDVR
jgi:hypothetical protein